MTVKPAPVDGGIAQPLDEQFLRDVAEIRSACGFMWMRMTVVKDVQDAYDVAKRECTDHEAAFKRLEDALAAPERLRTARDTPPEQDARYRCKQSEILEAMHRYGGGFVQQLARLFQSADRENRKKLEATFRDYFKQYDDLAALPSPPSREDEGKS